MTTNQIAYWNYVESARNHYAQEVETKRANLAREAETKRSNLANEAIGRMRNALTSMANEETQRANKAREIETNRSNVVNERERARVNSNDIGVSNLQLQEMVRNNLANNRTNLMVASEQAAHNRATEAETYRHDIQQETLSKFQTITQDKMNVRTTNAQKFSSALGSEFSQNTGQANVDVSKERNALTRRGQNLSLLSDVMNTGAQFYSSQVRGASTLIKGGF